MNYSSDTTRSILSQAYDLQLLDDNKRLYYKIVINHKKLRKLIKNRLSSFCLFSAFILIRRSFGQLVHPQRKSDQKQKNKYNIPHTVVNGERKIQFKKQSGNPHNQNNDV